VFEFAVGNFALVASKQSRRRIAADIAGYKAIIEKAGIERV